jgi:hypothetical protein
MDSRLDIPAPTFSSAMGGRGRVSEPTKWTGLVGQRRPGFRQIRTPLKAETGHEAAMSRRKSPNAQTAKKSL